MIMIGMVAIASATSILLREKIEKMLAPTIMVMVLLTYAFLNMGIPAIGLYITMFASVISVGVIVYFVFSDRKRIIECLATYGGLTIIILLGVLMIFSIGRRAVYGPDPGVWVGNVKKLYLNHPKSELVPTHPNFLIILGYLATKTWFRWAEGILLFAKDFFLMSCLVSFFAFVKNNTVLKSALLFFITVMIPFAQAGDSFGIFDVDGIMAITFGLALIYAAEYLKNRNNLDYCVFLIYLSSAVLTKRIAIIIATIII